MGHCCPARLTDDVRIGRQRKCVIRRLSWGGVSETDGRQRGVQKQWPVLNDFARIRATRHRPYIVTTRYSSSMLTGNVSAT